MSPIPDQRLSELISLAAQDPGPLSDWLQDTDAALRELQERRQRDAIVVDMLTALKESSTRLDILLTRGDLCTDKRDERITRQWRKRIVLAIQRAKEAGL